MAYSEDVARGVRETLSEAQVVWDELRMFGGLAFMVGGHMTIGILGDELMVRVGKEAHDEVLALPHARPMDFTGRPMTGYVFVAPAGFDGDSELQAWVRRGLAFTATLPAKTSSGARPR